MIIITIILVIASDTYLCANNHKFVEYNHAADFGSRVALVEDFELANSSVEDMVTSPRLISCPESKIWMVHTLNTTEEKLPME